jgi:hypothetical protein
MGIERRGWAPLSNCSATIVISYARFVIKNKSHHYEKVMSEFDFFSALHDDTAASQN